MNRRNFIKASSFLGATTLLSGCGFLKIDPNHFLIRSDVITSVEQEKEILSRAWTGWTDDKRMRVLITSGTPYERGYQHGKLLRREVVDNLQTLFDQAVSKFRFKELLAESYERQRPFITQEYIDEMHGLAHGSRLPLEVVHAMHALPEISEWGGKRKIKKVVKDQMEGILGTSCSNFAAYVSATQGNTMYTVRVLDWGLHRISKLHEYPLIWINIPDKGIPSANITWVGFLGAVSGMNAQGITLGEMGYGDPEGETMRGKPMPFLLRDVMTYAPDLMHVRKLISESPGTNSFVFLMSDGKTGNAELYVRDRYRFEVHHPGEVLKDEKKTFPAIENVVYGGHYDDRMTEALTTAHGTITPERIMKEIIPKIAMPSNFQNVVYDPAGLKFWVNNAGSQTERAAERPFTYFDFGRVLTEYNQGLLKMTPKIEPAPTSEFPAS